MKDLETKSQVYDIADAGPNNRFTIMTDKGPMLVHNCILGLGYGVGAKKLQHSLATSKPKVDIDDEESKRLVKVYRQRYYMIPRLWQKADEALALLERGYPSTIGVGIPLTTGDDRVFLPNGMAIYYNKLCRQVNPFTGQDGLVYYKKKEPKTIYGAKAVENIVQALARIVVFDQMVAIDNYLQTKSRKDGRRRSVCLMVHDEVVVCVPEEEMKETQAYMERCMSIPPVWAKGLPISCEAGSGYCYGDAK